MPANGWHEVYKMEDGKRVYAGTVKYNSENNTVRYGGGKGSYGNRMRTAAARSVSNNPMRQVYRRLR